MIPEECTHLAKANFPIAVLSKHSVLEKSMRHGLLSALHLWSVRQPLASVFLKVARIDIMKMSQNSGHTKNRSTIERRRVERHPHPNPLPAGEGARRIPSPPLRGRGSG